MQMLLYLLFVILPKLVFTSLKINAEFYPDNIQHSGMLTDLKGRQYVFMQDGASSHSAAATKEWLNSQSDFLLFWPPNSPDLNPIEMIWGIIKTKLNLLPVQLSDITELRESIQEILDSIEFDTINSLIENFYYCLFVATYEGETIQPFYRHHQELTDEEYIQKAEALLQLKSQDIQRFLIINN